MDVVTSQRWMLGSLNFICGCFYITPLKPLFLPGIPWSLLLDINGTFLHHTRGWTFLLDTMVVVTGLCFTIKDGRCFAEIKKWQRQQQNIRESSTPRTQHPHRELIDRGHHQIQGFSAVWLQTKNSTCPLLLNCYLRK